MSTQLTFVIAGVVALILLVTIVLILTRYKKCKSNELLVVYGKTKGDTTCRCYHGGSAFVWPVIQGYSIMSMDPFQIQCDLNGALSLQKIKVNIPTVVTVAISTKPEIMQNAAVRLLGLTDNDKINQIKDIVWGQLRLIVAKLSVEELISDKEKFQGSCIENIANELEKFGLALININIADISDSAEYIKNLGLEAASKAKFEALANIEKRTKEGEVGIATQKKEKEIQLSEITRDQEIQVADNQKQQAVRTAEIEKDKATSVEETNKQKSVALREIAKDKNVQVAEQAKEEAVKIREVEKDQEVETANLEKEQAEQISEIEKNKQITIATNESEQAQKVAEQKRLQDSEVAKQSAEAETAVATAQALRDAEIVKQRSESKAKQVEAEQKSEADIVEAQQESEARKETAKQESEAKQTQALREKESKEAEYDSDRRKRTAKADKDATLTENIAGIEVAKSNAELGKEKAESDRVIGESRAAADKAVGIAQAGKEAEIAKAQAKAEEEKLNAEIMVGTKIEAERKKTEAEGIKAKAITEAEGEAEAIKLKALAEAEAIKAKKLAEAEGAKQMAEAKKIEMQAETEGIANLARADVPDSVAVSYVLKDKLEGMIGAEMAKFEHIKLGNVTVVGGPEKAAQFMGNVANIVQGIEGLGSENIPGVMGLIGKLLAFDQKNQLTEESKDPKSGETSEEIDKDK